MGKHGSYPRVDGDHYPTPDWAIAALAEHVDLAGQLIWEPACGAGRMAEALKAAGATVYCSDVESRGFPLDALIDFTLASTAPNDFNGTIRIISNPAFGRQGKIADRFIEAGLRLIGGGGFLALLLAADFDSGKTRARFFRDCPLFAGKIVLTRRIVWFSNPDPEKERPKENHAWFLWTCPAPQTAPALLYAPRTSARDGRACRQSTPTSSEKGDAVTIKPSSTEKVVPLTVGNPAAAASLAIDQKHMEDFANPEAQSSIVACQRPAKGIFFTVLRETEQIWKDRKYYFMLEMEGRDPYIVAPEIAKEKGDEDTIRPVLIVRYVTMAGDEGLWALKLDRPDGKSNHWNTSALNIMELAASGKWVRIVSMKKYYRYQQSKKTLGEVPPKFTDQTFDELVNIAFKDRVITTLDHEIWDVLENGSDK